MSQFKHRNNFAARYKHSDSMESDAESLVSHMTRLSSEELLSFLKGKDDSWLKRNFVAFKSNDSTKFWNECFTLFEGVFNSLDNESSRDEAVLSLSLLSRLGLNFSTVNKERPNSFLQLIMKLNQLLGRIDDVTTSIESLKTIISTICENMYLAKEPNAEEFVPEVLKHLLLETLKPNAKDGTLKRLYALRHALLEIEVNHTEDVGMRDLLLRAFVHSSYLKCNEGQQLLAFVLQNYPRKRDVNFIFPFLCLVLHLVLNVL